MTASLLFPGRGNAPTDAAVAESDAFQLSLVAITALFESKSVRNGSGRVPVTPNVSRPGPIARMSTVFGAPPMTKPPTMLSRPGPTRPLVEILTSRAEVGCPNPTTETPSALSSARINLMPRIRFIGTRPVNPTGLADTLSPRRLRSSPFAAQPRRISEPWNRIWMR